jgi:acyl-CoA synthetase (AMP-forming)/AMP-acid ligase II
VSVNTVRSLLERATALAGDKVAIRLGRDELTYFQLLERVNQVANYLDTLGLKPNSKIGLFSQKSIEQVVAILAILSTKNLFVPITRLLKPEQIKHIIEDCSIDVLITDSHKVEKVKEIDFSGKIISFTQSSSSDVSFEEIYKCHSTKRTSSNLKGHDYASITYTFSTVGNPKGVVIDHKAFVDGARVVSSYLDISAEDTISGVLSFNVDYGLNQIFTTLYKRATLALHRFLLPEEFFSHLIDDRVTVLPLMPIHITEMFDIDPHKIPHEKHFSNLRSITSSGGNLTPTMVKNLKKSFKDAEIYSMHGLSEALRSSYLEPSQIDIRPNSIGKAIPDVELYVINEEQKECKPNEVGELIHRGAVIYKGYWRAPEETKKRFKSIEILKNIIDIPEGLVDEVVVASGDLVYRDVEGYLYLVGRKDDMIKTRGYRVSPNEIESVVLEYLPTVKECAVFSIPNSEIEEEIILVYNASKELSQKQIIFELKKHLANYMLPAKIIYHKNMPKKSLHTGVIDKKALKDEILKSL